MHIILNYTSGALQQNFTFSDAEENQLPFEHTITWHILGMKGMETCIHLCSHRYEGNEVRNTQ